MNKHWEDSETRTKHVLEMKVLYLNQNKAVIIMEMGEWQNLKLLNFVACFEVSGEGIYCPVA